MSALETAGRILGIVGIVVCAVSVVSRVTGHYTLGGYPVITLFEGGTTTLVAGCFCLLWALGPRR
jgi:hypothetical protein